MRDRSAFLYMEPGADTPDFSQCGTCASFIPDTQRCMWFSDNFCVDDDDSCGLYVQGTPRLGRIPLGLIEPSVAGFVDGAVRCENCVSLTGERCDLYAKLNRAMPSIWDLAETVKPQGCCNAFEGKAKEPQETNLSDEWRGRRRWEA